MFGRISRRRLARAAIERLEEQARAAKYVAEGAEEEARRARAEASAAKASLRGMAERLDDANAELARWGLELVTRDAPESDEHPQRYRRSSDWRVTRSAEELVELLDRSGIDDVPCEPDTETETFGRIMPSPYPSDYVIDGEQLTSERAWQIEQQLKGAGWRNLVMGVPNWPLSDIWQDTEGVEYPNMIKAWLALNAAGAAVQAAPLPCVPGAAGAWGCIHCGTLDYRIACPGRLPAWATADGSEPIEHAGELVDQSATGGELAAEAHRLRLELATVRGAHAAALLSETELRDELAAQKSTSLHLYANVDADRDALREALALAKAQIAELTAERDQARRELGDALTAASAAEAVVDHRAEELALQRVATEQAERSRDRAVAKADQLGLELEALRAGEAFKVPGVGDTFTVKLRDGMGEVRCRVLSSSPVGDFGFSLMLEPLLDEPAE